MQACQRPIGPMAPSIASNTRLCCCCFPPVSLGRGTSDQAPAASNSDGIAHRTWLHTLLRLVLFGCVPTTASHSGPSLPCVLRRAELSSHFVQRMPTDSGSRSFCWKEHLPSARTNARPAHIPSSVVLLRRLCRTLSGAGAHSSHQEG
eukprot:scaffold106444_cov30-Tisochrysis_lutea.AAC.2